MVAAKITGDAELDVAQRYVEGESIYRIAKDYGVGSDSVKRALLRQGVELRESPTARKLTAEEIEEAVQLYKDSDISAADLGRKIGVSRTTILGYLERRGVQARKNVSRGEAHGNWNGGRSIDKNSGYVKLRLQPNDPFYCMSSNGYVLEHRYVMAQMLGRPLLPTETVHHKDNTDRTNNFPSNLQLRKIGHGKGAAHMCGDCGSVNIVSAEL